MVQIRPIPLLVAALTIVACASSCHLRQNATAAWITAMRRLGLTSSPAALVNMSEHEIARIGPGTDNIDGIYFSDFVEKDNSNHIRHAAAFRHTADTLLGDKMMPLSHFSRFYGIENGRIKAGRLDQFADSTTVLPVRNRDCGYISKVELNREAKSRGWLYVRNPFQILRERRRMRLELRPLVEDGSVNPECLKPSWIREQLPMVTYYPPETSVTVYGIDGNVLHEPTVREARNGKIFLADSLGNAVFINNLPGLDEAELRLLNKLLEEHPMGTVIIDNGRYYRFMLSGGDYTRYASQDLYRPDSCLFVVGSILSK